jgi:hypothetical protein
MKGPRRRKLTELVPNHVFSAIDGYKLVPVVDRKSKPNHVRDNHRTPRPSTNDSLVACAVGHLNFPLQMRVQEWTLFQRPRHSISPNAIYEGILSLFTALTRVSVLARPLPFGASIYAYSRPSRLFAPTSSATCIINFAFLAGAVSRCSDRTVFCPSSYNLWLAFPTATADGYPWSDPLRHHGDGRPGSSRSPAHAGAARASGCDQPCLPKYSHDRRCRLDR